MRTQTDRRIADDPPADPTRVMPVVAAAITGLAVVAVLLAVAGVLIPLFSAGAMVASSLLAVANSARHIPGAPTPGDATDANPRTGETDTDDAHPPLLASEASDD